MKADDGFARTCLGINLDVTLMSDVYAKFGLEAGTQDFIGHAMALHLDDRLVFAPHDSANCPILPSLLPQLPRAPCPRDL